VSTDEIAQAGSLNRGQEATSSLQLDLDLRIDTELAAIARELEQLGPEDRDLGDLFPTLCGDRWDRPALGRVEVLDLDAYSDRQARKKLS